MKLDDFSSPRVYDGNYVSGHTESNTLRKWLEFGALRQRDDSSYCSTPSIFSIYTNPCHIRRHRKNLQSFIFISIKYTDDKNKIKNEIESPNAG